MKRAAVWLILAITMIACVGAIPPEFFESKYGRCVSTGGQMQVGDNLVTQLSTTCYTPSDAGKQDSAIDPDNPDDLQPPCRCASDGGLE